MAQTSGPLYCSRKKKKRDTLRSDILYLKSQSMRNNLVFTGVSESLSSEHEAAEMTKRKLRAHLHEALHLVKDMADSVRLLLSHHVI